MTARDIQKKIESFHYWDARVHYLNCNHFADEIELIYCIEEDMEVVCSFTGCCKSLFDHVKHYDKCKPVREMNIAQMPYFLHDVKIDEIVENGVEFYVCKIVMFPLGVEIWCKYIEIYTRAKSSNSLDTIGNDTFPRHPDLHDKHMK